MKRKQIALLLPLLLLPISAGGFVHAYVASGAHAGVHEHQLCRLPMRHFKLKRHIKPTWDTTLRPTLPPRKSVAQEIADLKAGR
ncbi:hypothetical protein CCAX7_001780 [Capsulimonas corticalis]|uniref:Uncharacterized protein n=1 Tax=Capsulimonas corticalis TaxID=2219043 RepID=A0A402CRR3_9BACT|nr:hypothetical protein [Capsulimonas corticalis]BDI28127.1 hypothetical protein CCAX7_001780 [Capsulimonas corticalis]